MLSVPRKAVAGAATVAVSMGLVAGIALGEAAPANANVGTATANALFPILGDVFGATSLGSFFNGIGGHEPPPSLGNLLGIPMFSDEAIFLPDFWTIVPPPPNPWKKDTAVNAEGVEEPVDTTRNEDHVQSIAEWAANSPENPDYTWINETIVVDSFKKMDVANSSGHTHELRWHTTMGVTSATQNKNIRGMVTRTAKCFDPATGTTSVIVTKAVGVGMVQTAGSLSAVHTFNPCPSSSDRPLSVKMVPPSTADKLSKMTSTTTGYNDMRWTSQVLTWLSKDAPDPVDPRYSAEVQCTDPAGGSPITIRSDISIPKDGTPMNGLNVPSCAAAGLGPAVGMEVGYADGDTKEAPIFTYTQTDDPMLDCDPAFGAPCKMQVYIDGMPCSVGNQACMSWSGLYRTASYRVECRYGGKVVDISGCGILEGAYIPGGTPAVAPNTDGNPDTWINPGSIPNWVPHKETESGPIPDEEWKIGAVPQVDPNPNPDPNITTDPAPQPEPSTDPAPEPSPSTSPGPEPSPSTSPGPDPATDPTGDPATDPTGDPTFPNPEGGQDDVCGYKWGWDPFSWVGKQLQCAFVPQKDIKSQSQSTAANFAARVPFTFPGAIGAPGGGGCPNWVVHVGTVHKNFVCDSSFTAAIVNVRAPLFGLVSTAMVWPLLRSVWYASIPILRVTPSSGK